MSLEPVDRDHAAEHMPHCTGEHTKHTYRHTGMHAYIQTHTHTQTVLPILLAVRQMTDAFVMRLLLTPAMLPPASAAGNTFRHVCLSVLFGLLTSKRLDLQTSL